MVHKKSFECATSCLHWQCEDYAEMTFINLYTKLIWLPNRQVGSAILRLRNRQ